VSKPRLCVDEAAEAVVDAFRNYELVERGLAELTVVNACYLARGFLAWRAATGRPPLEQLDAVELGEYITYQSGRLQLGSMRPMAGALRALCRFLFATGVTPMDVSGAVPSVSGIRFDGLPKAVDRPVVEALLESCARQTPVGRRDYAILMLMVRLGLRAVEITRMELGDLDWRAGELLVRGKGGRRDRMPLPDDVGQAVADYLVNGRRATGCRAVFLAALGEPVAMTRNAVVFVSRTASLRAGISTVGGHRLRHTAGTELLRAGASLREVGEVLRQGDRMTTAIYATIDERSLRSVIRPWPAG
jgi:integrase/recombinase XerD